MVKLRVRDTGNRWGEKTWKVDIREYTSYYVVSDHLGSPRVAVQDDGTTVAWQDYYPFGMTMPGRSYDASAPADQSGFTGYQFEEEGGLDLYHAEARNYDPVIGRFTSRDPLAQHFPSWTPYHYVHNNPISLTDPTGMSAECQKGSCVENKKPLRLVEFKAQNSRWIVPDENIVDHRPITYGAPPLAIPLIGKVIATTYAAIEAALITASAFLLAKMGYETLEQELLLKASHANWDSLWGAARPDENSEKNIRQQDGGYEQALKDFESLNPTGIEVIYDKKGEAIGKSGILPDGNGVTVRKRAVTDPRPTLERHVPRIRNHKKIRYNP
jgi:RHS repeat-associated protein